MRPCLQKRLCRDKEDGEKSWGTCSLKYWGPVENSEKSRRLWGDKEGKADLEKRVHWNMHVVSLLREPFVTSRWVSISVGLEPELWLLEQSIFIVQLTPQHIKWRCKDSLYSQRGEEELELQFSRGKSRHLLRSVPSLLLSLILAFWRALCTWRWGGHFAFLCGLFWADGPTAW